MALPTDCWWSDGDGASHCRWHGGCVAVVRPGRVVIMCKGFELSGASGSIAQGKRFVERWLAAHGVPLFNRKQARARMAENQERRHRLAAAFFSLPPMPRQVIQPHPESRGPQPLPPVPKLPQGCHWRP